MTDPASQHPYMYCRGNPISYADPSGYERAYGPTGTYEWDNQDRPTSGYGYTNRDQVTLSNKTISILNKLHRLRKGNAPKSYGKRTVYCDEWREGFVTSRNLKGSFTKYVERDLRQMGYRNVDIEPFGADFIGTPPHYHDGHQWAYLKVKANGLEVWISTESNYKGRIYQSLQHRPPDRKINPRTPSGTPSPTP